MRIVWFLLFACVAAPLWAAEPGILFDPADSLGTGARPAALGSAFAAVPGGLDSLDWNPAGLDVLTRPMVGFHHQSWLNGVNREAVDLAFPSGRWGVFAGSFHETLYGNYENRDDDGNLTGTFRPHRDALKVSWARSVFRNFSVALSVENQQIYLSGLDFARLSMGGGILWRTPSGIGIGASFSGFGTYVGTIPSAQTWRIASWLPLRIWPDHPTHWALATAFQPYGVTRLQTGVEQTITDRFALRAGYQLSIEDMQVQGFKGFSAGFGLKWKQWTLDYAFLPVENWGATHRVSLQAVLGKDVTVTPTPSPSPTFTPTPVPSFTMPFAPAPQPTMVESLVAAKTPTVVPSPTPSGRTLRLYFEVPDEGANSDEKPVPGLRNKPTVTDTR